ncbi:hypothetical protein NM688_g9099 [Phlebia brevispora]|uniref:Uncharacterized protein n=1 Tax=Phlebia brevispora TaxID=194682 RepID=A0ACC1RL96_9APHY|nr:hypothetical protein NM688_g9099 [Phlebia brevispora]
MAVPATMTTLNLSGKYTQNKALSDDTEEILRLQGVSFMTRKALGMTTLTVTLTHTKDGDVEKVVTEQVLSGGVGASTEERILDWEARPYENKLFNKTTGKSKRVKLDEIEEEYLKGGWAPAAQEHGVISIWAEGVEVEWVTNAMWGLEEVNGEVRYVRRVHFTGPKGEKVQARIVFDYVGDA